MGRGFALPLEACPAASQRQSAKGLIRINPAGGKEDDRGSCSSRQFVAVDGAEEVCIDEVVGGAFVAGQNGRFRGAFDENVRCRQLVQVAPLPDVSMYEADVMPFET
jgi:hypothetical protein